MVRRGDVFGWQWCLSLLAWGVLVAACSGGPSQDRDPCRGVSCEFGACDSETGQCVNEQECEPDAEACLPGYECVEGTCVGLEACSSEDDCEAGTCSDGGVCVNPDTCSEDAECLPGTYCEFEEGETDATGTCAADPCREMECDRGVCERGVGECISAESCTEETESDDCVAGEKCAVEAGAEEGECRGSGAFCEALTCERGECSFEAGGCRDAPDCDGDDEKCLEGNYCNGMDQCQPDLCEQNDVDCGRRGICDRTSGECENAETCESNDDCLNDPKHLCVEGTCRLATSACGDADGDGGCPGNQTCEYDAQELTASCQEPDTCETTFDCQDDGRCAGNECLDPRACTPDRFEPNDDPDRATDFHEVTGGKVVAARVCQSDVDQYTIQATELIEPGETGTLIVRADVPAADRGLGAVKLRVVGPDGSEVGTAETGALGHGGRAEVTRQIGIPDYGEYRLEVEAAGDVRAPGVHYDLSAEIVADDGLEACGEATEISIDDSSVTGAVEDGESTGLGSSCTEPRNPAPEQVFALEVDQSQEVDLELEPLSDEGNLTMSLRSDCAMASSERACANGAAAGESEELTVLLEEGTHYVIVQAPADASQAGEGGFSLSIDRTYTVCAPGDAYCNEGGRANVCGDGGDSFEELTCTKSCNRATGRCRPPEGNRCWSAPSIEPGEAGARTIHLNQLDDAYRLEPTDCLTERGVAPEIDTAGPDQTYRVEVPPKTVMSAEVEFADGVDGSMYLIDECGDPGGTCRRGAHDTRDQESREQLVHPNLSEESDETDNTDTMYLVVDTPAGTSPSTAELEVTYEDVVCSPGAERCHAPGGGGAEDAQQCGEYGRGWEVREECGLGCADASCLGDSCDDPVVVPADGNTHTYSFDTSSDAYTNHYDISYASCGPTGDVDNSDGPEAVFEVQAQAGDLIEATWDHDDPSLYIVSDCSDVGGSCGHGMEAATRQQVEASYVAPQAGTYYVMADVDDAFSTSYGTGTATVRVAPATCNPHGATGRCDGTDGIESCTWAGDWGATRSCVQCASGSCAGNTCADAIDVPVDGSDHTFQLNPEAYSGEYDIDGASCMSSSYDDSTGPEAVFRIGADDGDIIEASWEHDDPSMYLVENCSDLQGSCVAGVESSTDEEVGFIEAVSGPGPYYLMADVDESATNYREGTVTISATAPDCEPSTYSPICVDSETSQVCDSYGRYAEQPCPCSSNGCDGDTCGDAVSVPTDGQWHDYTFNPGDSYSDEYDIDGASCMSSSSDDSDGPDAVFSIDADDGDIIEATWDHDDPSMYLVEDCSDLQNSCVAGVESASDEEVGLTHKADGAGTYYLVADVDEASTDYREGSLSIKASPEQCDPSSYSPVCADSETLQVCDSYGRYADQPCPCSSGSCDGNTCSDAVSIPADDSWHEYTFNPDEAYDDQHDIDQASCMPGTYDDSPGPEAVFSVDASAGDLIEVTWDHDDPSLYLSSSCSGIGSACEAGVESSSAEEVGFEYEVTSDGTYYLFADVDEASTDYREGTFRARVNTQQCSPQNDSATCADSSTRRYCSDQYEVWREEPCEGCSGGGCAGSCSNPLTLADGETDNGAYSDLTNDLDPEGTGQTGSCTFPEETAGGDVVYAVDLAANEQLTADASSDSSFGVFYLLSDCSDTTTCLGADDGDGTITHQAGSSPETVYIVIDHESYTSSSPPGSSYDGYSLDVTVQ